MEVTTHIYVLLCTSFVMLTSADLLGRIEQQLRQRAPSRRLHTQARADTCEAVLCPHGTHCVNKQIQCPHEPCPFVAVCEATKAFPNFCDQSRDAGSCGSGLSSQTQERWFYNKTSAQCEAFEYSGCGGNDNKYLSRGHCERSCVRLEECFLRPEAGHCRARFIRYYYNVLEAECQPFVYGGCKGNGNNFIRQDSCMQKCYIAEFDNPEFNRSFYNDDAEDDD